MNKVKKSIIALLISAFVCLSGVAIFSAAQSGIYAYADTERVWTYEEVETLETLRKVPAEQIASWQTYDSRKYNIVTSVKNQGSTSLCWVYGSLAAMETNILRQGFTDKTNETLNLDEVEFAKAAKGKWDDPLDNADGTDNRKNGSEVSWNQDGAISMVTQFASRGQGVYEEGEITDDEPQERYSSYLLRNAITCDNEVDQIKKLIAEYGGVAFTYHSGYINYNYYYATGLKDHASFIVGWDDTVDKNLFNNTTKPAAHNGAWIVKNSYGAESFIDGYFYLSYDSVLYEITAFEMMSADEYDWCYNYSDKVYTTASYSECSPTDEQNAEFAAVYQAKKGDEEKEFLKGVSVGVTGNDVEISVSVYTDVPETSVTFGSGFDPKNGTLSATVEYTAPATGIYTIPLVQPVEVVKDCYFTVIVKVANGKMVCDTFAFRSGKTFTYVYDSGKWNQYQSPLLREVLCIKALTVTHVKEESIDISNGTLSLSADSYVYTGSAHTPEVALNLNGEEVSAENYTVTYANNINAGTATVEVVGTGSYIGTLSTTFAIAKAPQPKNAPAEISVPEGATKLEDIELPEGWQWLNPDTELKDTLTVVAQYCGDDKDNYRSTTLTFVITVETPEEEEPDDREEPNDDSAPDEEIPPYESEGPNEGTTPDESQTPSESQPNNDMHAGNGGGNVGPGIGIGIGIFAIIVVGVIIFFVFRRYKKR